ncbi:type II secretion system F family protein [Christensenellaceae bacterium OttesenSCG-928-K19]|nr:type II secretion system F family protein [Christensenellaceae bacterium OttesenSCG-928-K19]
MSNFRYTARDAQGKTVKGELTAPSVSEFYAALRGRQLYALEYSEVQQRQALRRRHHKMTTKELILFCRKLGTMMHSGLSMTGAYDVLVKTADTLPQKELFLSVYESIQRGQPLSEAMRQEGGAFPPFLTNMVESGEASGNLDKILLSLATHYENENKIQQKIKSASTYPVILLVVSIAVVLLLFTFVLPRMLSMFEGAEVPPITQFVLDVSNFLTVYWPAVVLAVVALAILLLNQRFIPPLKYFLDMAKLRFPAVGKMNRTVYSSRFARSMSMLYASGIPMLSSLRLSANILGNLYIDKLFAGLMQEVSMGESLSSSIERINVFDNLLPSMIRVGEEAGSLDTVLTSISDYYDQESQSAVNRMITILEPVMLAVLAVIITIVLAAVMLPIYSMYNTLL